MSDKTAATALTLSSQRPEFDLANLMLDGNPLERLWAITKAAPQDWCSRRSTQDEIRAELDYNWQLLSVIPEVSIVEDFAARVKAALNPCTRDVVLKQIEFLIGAFPNFRPQNPEIYARTFVYDLIDLRIPDAITVLAAREIRRTSKFPPTIAEFVEVANRTFGLWRCAESLPRMVGETRAKISGVITRQQELLTQVSA